MQRCHIWAKERNDETADYFVDKTPVFETLTKSQRQNRRKWNAEMIREAKGDTTTQTRRGLGTYHQTRCSFRRRLRGPL
jgi:hypothetical protein